MIRLKTITIESNRDRRCTCAGEDLTRRPVARVLHEESVGWIKQQARAKIQFDLLKGRSSTFGCAKDSPAMPGAILAIRADHTQFDRQIAG
ncbi:hypothetical protein DBIPINDM_007988 (plasmid) [Mesorhizobium sp. AR02]|nr:hypothetical protein DBIPINDM_007988 [Mesorhizobium sp. AR02]